jgi:UDP-glucose 4-epimerase
MRILVTGGAGYIGSHMTRLLVKAGHTPVVLDSLEFGHRQALPSSVKLYVGNVSDEKILKQVFQNKIDAVIHFAGYISVPESVTNPTKYMVNNFLSPIQLLIALVRYSIKYIIFSSTAAVYGQPETVPIPESHPKNPTSPYGLSKLCFEQVLGYYDRQFDLKSISLRYFNACGANPNGRFGEDHSPEGHIIPNAIKAAINHTPFTLFGTDFPTPDGTCIRDYIHIDDLCSAHLLALDALKNGHKTGVFNAGTGTGHSNQEIIKVIKKVAGDFPVKLAPRRPGDPAKLVADSTRLQKELGWKPRSSDISTIIKSAFKWHSSHPKGYSDRSFA